MTGKERYEERRRLEAERHLDQERRSAEYRASRDAKEASEARMNALGEELVGLLEDLLAGRKVISLRRSQPGTRATYDVVIR